MNMHSRLYSEQVSIWILGWAGAGGKKGVDFLSSEPIGEVFTVSRSAPENKPDRRTSKSFLAATLPMSHMNNGSGAEKAFEKSRKVFVR